MAEDKIKWRESIHYLLLKLTDIIDTHDIFHIHLNTPDNLDNFIKLNMIAHNKDDSNIHPVRYWLANFRL